jgi:(S)-mandelate dehydrogenase
LLRPGLPRFENIIEFVPPDQRGFFDSAFWVRSHMDLALTWDSITRMRDLWPRKFLVKGVLSVADVMRAAEIGADGVVLSNHGGRQLDSAISGLEILPEACRVAGDRMTILVDGGIRRGTDVVKALALGAHAVLVGRAVLYGVAAGGKAGAARALAILHQEIDRTLGLLNVPSIDALGPHLLARETSTAHPASLTVRSDSVPFPHPCGGAGGSGIR